MEADRDNADTASGDLGDEAFRDAEAGGEDDLAMAITDLDAGADVADGASGTEQEDRDSPIAHPIRGATGAIAMQEPGALDAHPAVAEALTIAEGERRGLRQGGHGEGVEIIGGRGDIAGDRRHSGDVFAHAGAGFAEKTDAAPIEPKCALAHVEDEAGVVGDDEQGDAAVHELTHAAGALLLKHDVAHAEGFVDDEDVGLDGDRDGKGHAHHHAGGVGFNRLLDEGADIGEFFDLGELAIHLVAADAENGAGEVDILAARKLGVEARTEFEERGDAAADVTLAFGGLERAGENLQEGALTGAVATDDAEGLAFRDAERDVAHGGDVGRVVVGDVFLTEAQTVSEQLAKLHLAAVDLAQIDDLDGRRHGDGGPRGRERGRRDGLRHSHGYIPNSGPNQDKRACTKKPQRGHTRDSIASRSIGAVYSYVVPSTSTPAPSPAPSSRSVMLAGLGLVLAALVAYHNSFDGHFFYDDGPAIKDNPTIRDLGNILQVLSPPSGTGVTVNGRPLVNLSLAINYAFGGTKVFGYHVMNLLIHVCAGLALFGIVRRSLQLPGLRERFAGKNDGLLAALAVAAIWTLHPLQTESVTYIIQRAEALVGMFYLLTLYCFVRSVTAPHPGRWQVLSVLACFCGMASKEVMASAPLIVFFYDRSFVSGTFKAAWKKHFRLYVGLAASWLLLWAVMRVSGNRGGTAGLGAGGITSWDYAITQCLGLGKYLKLSFWPSPLVFDYGVRIQKELQPVLPQAILIVTLVVATAYALWRKPILGFLGLFFFAILGPSSSFIPVATEPLAEHRMYLPLAALIALVVIGVISRAGRGAAIGFLGLAVVAAGLTIHRNEDFRDDGRLWASAKDAYPTSERAYNNLGEVYSKAEQTAKALECFREAVRLTPNYIDALNNLGITLNKLGQPQEAFIYASEAKRLRPTSADASNTLGHSYYLLDRFPEAIANYNEALQLKPDFAEAHNNLAVALSASGRNAEAIPHAREAIRLKEEYADGHFNYGNALRETGHPEEALAEYKEALRIQPIFPKALNNLGTILWNAGKQAEARPYFAEAARQDPTYVDAIDNLGMAAFNTQQYLEAGRQFETALRIAPNHERVRNNLAKNYNFMGAAAINEGRLAEARGFFEKSIQLNPRDPTAFNNLGVTISRMGDPAAALPYFEQAVALQPDYESAKETAAAIRAQLQKKP